MNKRYIRAGSRKTEAEWKERLGEFNIKWAIDWFIDLEESKDQEPIDELRELINDVFNKRGLNSVTYKQAAKEIAEIWLKQNK